VGVLAALRSKRLDGKTIGVMVTASHNPEQVCDPAMKRCDMCSSYLRQDNGVKLVDPRGEMLEASWEVYATSVANAPTTADFIEALQALISSQKIDLSRPGRVIYARDTRPSGPALVAALEDGLKALNAEARNEGVQTTPILHYLVRCINTRGTKDEYGEATVEGYYKKLGEAFKKLVVSKPESCYMPLFHCLFRRAKSHLNR